MKIYSDGATVGHNGPLGTVSVIKIGVYIPGINLKYSNTLKGISNNEAEFSALIIAMHLAIKHKIRTAEFHLDSKIVYNRACGKRPKSRKLQNTRMDNFQDRVLALIPEFKKVTFKWIPRELNTIADGLSNRG